MERKHPGVRFVHLDIFFDMTVQVYRYGLHDVDDDDDDYDEDDGDDINRA